MTEITDASLINRAKGATKVFWLSALLLGISSAILRYFDWLGLASLFFWLAFLSVAASILCVIFLMICAVILHASVVRHKDDT